MPGVAPNTLHNAGVKYRAQLEVDVYRPTD